MDHGTVPETWLAIPEQMKREQCQFVLQLRAQVAALRALGGEARRLRAARDVAYANSADRTPPAAWRNGVEAVCIDQLMRLGGLEDALADLARVVDELTHPDLLDEEPGR